MLIRVNPWPRKSKGVSDHTFLCPAHQCYRIWTRNAYKTALRKKNYYNVVDTIHAWGNIGWGAKGDEKVWIA